jgi:hypothetical protein
VTEQSGFEDLKSRSPRTNCTSFCSFCCCCSYLFILIRASLALFGREKQVQAPQYHKWHRFLSTTTIFNTTSQHSSNLVILLDERKSQPGFYSVLSSLKTHPLESFCPTTRTVLSHPPASRPPLRSSTCLEASLLFSSDASLCVDDSLSVQTPRN